MSVNLTAVRKCQRKNPVMESCPLRTTSAGLHWCLLGCFGFILLLKRIFLFGKLCFEDFTVMLK